MKLKLFVTLGIVSFMHYLRAQDAYPSTASTNLPAQMAPQPMATPPPMANYVNHLGIGAELGEPFGINAKYWLNDFMAVDGAVGWSPQGHSDAELHADLLVHKFDLVTVPEGRLPFYIGGGAFVRFRDKGYGNLAGLRVPIGVSYMFERCPVDVFAEFSPELIVAPFARGGISGGVGFRYWF